MSNTIFNLPFNVLFFTIIHTLVYLSMNHFFSHTLTPKSWVKKPFLYTLPFALLPSVYEIIACDSRSALRLFIFVLTFSLIPLLFYQGKVSYRLGSWSFCIIVCSISEWVIFMFVWKFILNFFDMSYMLSYEEISISTTMTFQQLCIYFLPPVIVECLICILSETLWNRFVSRINLIIFLEIGFTACILYSGALIVLPETFGFPGWILFGCALFVLFLFFLDGVQKVQQFLYRTQINKKKKEILNQDLDYYNKMEAYNLKIRKQNHDISNHLQAINFLIQQGNKEKAQNYIKELLSSFSEMH